VEKAMTDRRPLTFNGSLEAGVRALAILGAAYPHSYDLQRLTALDYLLVHTQQLGGPEDLHPSAPINTPATEVRRRIVSDAVLLMTSKGLVTREIHPDGIRFSAGEFAPVFLESLRTPYSVDLKKRANWLVRHLAAYSDSEFDALMKGFFDDWVVEFQHAERSLGADS